MITKKLHRKKNHRELLLRNQVTSLFLYEKIDTSTTKAKITKSLAEKLVNKAKIDDLSHRREVISYLLDKNAVKKLYQVILPRINDRKSGYFKTFRIGRKIGDGSEIMRLQFIDYKPIEKPKDVPTEELEKPTTKAEIKREKRISKLSKDQTRGEVTTIVRKKGERRISGEK